MKHAVYRNSQKSALEVYCTKLSTELTFENMYYAVAGSWHNETCLFWIILEKSQKSALYLFCIVNRVSRWPFENFVWGSGRSATRWHVPVFNRFLWNFWKFSKVSSTLFLYDKSRIELTFENYYQAVAGALRDDTCLVSIILENSQKSAQYWFCIVNRVSSWCLRIFIRQWRERCAMTRALSQSCMPTMKPAQSMT